jgi:hypothetical protein
VRCAQCEKDCDALGEKNLRVVKEVANAASVFREVTRVTHDHPYQAIIDAANTKNAI